MRLLPNPLARRPLPAEYDLCGVVVDENDTEFVPGDQVFGFIQPGEIHPFWLQFLSFHLILSNLELALSIRQGALAQYARIPSDYLVTRPSNVSPIEACGIPLAAQTAYQALIDIGQLEPGQTILVNGGSSAVGAFAIQIAKYKGANVVATASTHNEEYVRQQGADQASLCSFCFACPHISQSSLTTPRLLYMNILLPILLLQNSI